MLLCVYVDNTENRQKKKKNRQKLLFNNKSLRCYRLNNKCVRIATLLEAKVTTAYTNMPAAANKPPYSPQVPP